MPEVDARDGRDRFVGLGYSHTSIRRRLHELNTQSVFGSAVSVSDRLTLSITTVHETTLNAHIAVTEDNPLSSRVPNTEVAEILLSDMLAESSINDNKCLNTADSSVEIQKETDMSTSNKMALFEPNGELL